MLKRNKLTKSTKRGDNIKKTITTQRRFLVFLHIMIQEQLKEISDRRDALRRHL